MRALRVALALIALAGTSCARHAQERQALIDFFEAARLHDTTVLSNMGTVTFDPRTDGVVQQFDIDDVERQEVRSEAGVTESRRVMVAAQVRTPAGQLASERFAVTMRREIPGRWVISELRRAPASSAP